MVQASPGLVGLRCPVPFRTSCLCPRGVALTACITAPRGHQHCCSLPLQDDPHC